MLLTRSVVFISVSLTLAAGLLGSLFVIAGIDPAALLGTIAGVDRLYFALIVLATFIHLYLSAEKWRLVMACTVTEKGGHMPRVAYFFYTALGALFGQVMPQQVSTAVVRGVGMRLERRGKLVHGGAATVFEQSFDGLIYLLLVVPTVLVLVLAVPARVWLAAAAALTGLALVSMLIVVPRMQRLLHWAGGRSNRLWGVRHMNRIAGRVAQTGLIHPRPVMALFALSLLRLLMLMARAVGVALGSGLSVSAWSTMILLPAVQLAAMLSLTPGSLGVVEWTWSSLLALSGAPLSEAGQYALIHRLLSIGAIALTLLFAAAGYALNRVSRAVPQRTA